MKTIVFILTIAVQLTGIICLVDRYNKVCMLILFAPFISWLIITFLIKLKSELIKDINRAVLEGGIFTLFLALLAFLILALMWNT